MSCATERSIVPVRTLPRVIPLPLLRLSSLRTPAFPYAVTSVICTFWCAYVGAPGRNGGP